MCLASGEVPKRFLVLSQLIQRCQTPVLPPKRFECLCLGELKWTENALKLGSNVHSWSNVSSLSPATPLFCIFRFFASHSEISYRHLMQKAHTLSISLGKLDQKPEGSKWLRMDSSKCFTKRLFYQMFSLVFFGFLRSQVLLSSRFETSSLSHLAAWSEAKIGHCKEIRIEYPLKKKKKTSAGIFKATWSGWRSSVVLSPAMRQIHVRYAFVHAVRPRLTGSLSPLALELCSSRKAFALELMQILESTKTWNMLQYWSLNNLLTWENLSKNPTICLSPRSNIAPMTPWNAMTNNDTVQHGLLSREAARPFSMHCGSSSVHFATLLHPNPTWLTIHLMTPPFTCSDFGWVTMQEPTWNGGTRGK